MRTSELRSRINREIDSSLERMFHAFDDLTRRNGESEDSIIILLGEMGESDLQDKYFNWVEEGKE
jgi:hypothetical protein